MKKTKSVKDIEKNQTSKGFYTIYCRCSNCDWTGPADMVKGYPVPDKFDCPNCGCCTASKCSKPLPIQDYWPKHWYHTNKASDKTVIVNPLTIQPVYIPAPCPKPSKSDIWCSTVDEVHSQGANVTCGIDSKIGSKQHSKTVDSKKFMS